METGIQSVFDLLYVVAHFTVFVMGWRQGSVR